MILFTLMIFCYFSVFQLFPSIAIVLNSNNKLKQVSAYHRKSQSLAGGDSESDGALSLFQSFMDVLLTPFFSSDFASPHIYC